MRQVPQGERFRRARSRRKVVSPGFSLVEAMIALAILALVFTAIASAIGAGTASAGETRTRVVATLAADELLAEVLASDWDELTQWDGFTEPVGTGRAPDGRPEPARKDLARNVQVIELTRTLQPVGIEVAGRSVLIEVRDDSGRVLCTLERFVPQPTWGAS